MSSNYNWVCFDCRYVKREAKTADIIPKCLQCKQDLYCLGYKVAVPKKTDLKSWIKIKETSFKRDINNLENNIIERVEQKHRIEKEINRVKQLNDNKENRRKIKELETYLLKFVNNN